MSRVIVAYIAAGLCLFGALFASFALTGLGRPAPLAEEAADSAAAEDSPEPAAPAPGAFIPPILEPGRAYRLSHQTPVYSEPSAKASDAQSIPDGSDFTYLRTVDSPPATWFEISLRDGDNERSMYMNPMDLRWKIVTPIYSAAEAAEEQREAARRWFKEQGSLFRSRPAVEAPPPEPEPQEFAQWWASTAEGLGGASAANLIVSGVAAGITTVLTLGAIGLLSLFRRQNAWTRPAIYTRDGELIDVDDPYALSSAEDSPQEDDEDTGRRHA